MKKTLLALAAITATGAAMADVTLWGVLDTGITHVSTSNGSSTQMANGGGEGANKLGFKGTEDLGSGLWSAFYLENGFNASNGAEGTPGVLFNRRSTVSLGGDWGELRFGRDFNVTFENYVLGEAYGDHSIVAGGDGFQYNNKAVNGTTQYFVNNAIKYSYGFDKNDSTWGFGAKGLYFELQAALAGNASGTDANGQYFGGRLGYASGPWNVNIAHADSTGAPVANTGGVGTSGIKFSETNFALTYLINGITLIGSGGNNSSNDVGNPKFTHYTLGAQIPLGRGYIPVSYANTQQSGVSGSSSNLLGIGYVYPLSKRTFVYGYVSSLKNGNQASYVPGDSGSTLTTGMGSSVSATQAGLAVEF